MGLRGHVSSAAAACPAGQRGREEASARSGAPASTTTATAPATPKLRLEDMDRDGLAASVIYGPLVARVPDRRSRAPDAPATRPGTTGRWRSSTPPRPIGLRILAFLPSHSPDAAAAELERCAALGHRGAIIDVFASTSAIRPGIALWAAAEHDRAPDQLPHQGRHLPEAQLPDRQVAVGRVRHRSCRCSSTSRSRRWSSRARSNGTPGLRLVLAESGVGWLPYFLTRMPTCEWHELCATSSTTRRASRRASWSGAR